MSLLCISQEDQTDTQSQFTLNQLRQYSNALIVSSTVLFVDFGQVFTHSVLLRRIECL